MRAPTDASFLRACRGEPVDSVPVWFMRQAGRSLPEYRAIKGTTNLLQAVAQPELAAEITLQPVRRYGVDAAILYSDIVVPVHAIGFGVDIVAGVGPVVESPVRTPADLDRLRPLEPETDVPYVIETVKLVVRELDVPLIGFAGAPFTVASYLVEGRPSRDYVNTRRMMWAEPALFRALLDRLADIAIASLRAQVGAGAAAVQLFDSWAGALDPDDYAAHVLPSLQRVLEGVADLGVPRIVSGVGAAGLLGQWRAAGADVVSVDSSITLDEARRRAPGAAVQGNLDPWAVALAPWEVVEAKAREVLAANAGRPGHVFNLGHGVRPDTDPDVLKRIVDLVHAEGVSDGR
ncbi:MAG TPA: uroporphyrinogen decarboxylase [Acidimicrobiales bacterium]|nr:uroporphyrinogen decarboxylase [Acidimicrobiales bacterium]